MTEKTTGGTLWEEESREILEKFQELLSLYRMEYSNDLSELFNEFGYLLICRLSEAGYFENAENQSTEGMQDTYQKIDFYSITAEEVLHYVRNVRERFRKEKGGSPALQQLRSLRVEDIQITIAIQKISILRRMLMVMDDLINLYFQYREKERLESVILQIHDVCLKTKNDGNSYILPEQITELLVELLYMGRKWEDGKLLDPHCGSGTMLIAAKKYLETAGGEDISLNGFESNRSLRVCALILGILTDTEMTISEKDFLESRAEEGERISGDHKRDAGFDMVLSIPPFSNEMMKNAVFFPDVSFPVFGRYNLFLMQSIRALKEQGRAAVIVPDSFLFATKRETKNVRKWIMERYWLEAVVTLPPKIFWPNTAVNSSALFIRVPFMENGWADGTPYVLFYQLSNKGGEDETSEELLRVWKQKEHFFEQWQNSSQNRVENYNNVLTPGDWEPETFWFADTPTIRESKWNLLPSHYQPAVQQELKFENPEKLLGELIGEQEKLLKDMQELMEAIHGL